MYITKRINGYYFVEYFDKSENRRRRISTKTKTKKEALKFLSEFKFHLQSQNKMGYISLAEFKEEYMSFISKTHSPKYLSSINLSFNQLIYFIGNAPLKRITNKITQRFLNETYKS